MTSSHDRSDRRIAAILEGLKRVPDPSRGIALSDQVVARIAGRSPEELATFHLYERLPRVVAILALALILIMIVGRHPDKPVAAPVVSPETADLLIVAYHDSDIAYPDEGRILATLLLDGPLP